jgi:5,10-methylenetetrahydromethanopterin reductase
VKIGIFVSETWDAPSPIDEVRERAQAAEQIGLASAWVPYLPWSLDALASVQAAGDVTRAIELGTAVIPTYFFHPLALARHAATCSAAVGRAITLGVGCSNQFVVEMHGLAYERPAAHAREYLEVLEAARQSADGHVLYRGQLFRIEALYGTPGTSIGSLLLGALGPHMLRAAGAHSDGTIATWCNERAIERAIRPALEEAAKQAGRPAPRVAAVVPVVVTDDVAAARARAAEKFAIYDSLTRYLRMVELGGLTSAAEVCIAGNARHVRDRLRAYADAGLTDLLAAPLQLGEDRGAAWRRTAEALAALA